MHETLFAIQSFLLALICQEVSLAQADFFGAEVISLPREEKKEKKEVLFKHRVNVGVCHSLV